MRAAFMALALFLLLPNQALAISTGDINCDGNTNVVDVQLTIVIILNLPINPALDSDQDGVPDACPEPGLQCGEDTIPNPEEGVCTVDPQVLAELEEWQQNSAELTQELESAQTTIAQLQSDLATAQAETTSAYEEGESAGYEAGLAAGSASVEPGTDCVQGCTDPAYANYDPNATVDNGSCTGLPDLAPCLTLDKEYTFTAGNLSYLPNCLHNVGDLPAEGTITLWLDDEEILSNTWMINPGSTTSTSYSWTPQQEGWHTAKWGVDPDGVLTESNEDNNILEVTFYVEPAPEGLPDFAPCANLVNMNTSMVEGENINLSNCLENLGAVPGAGEIRLSLNDELLLSSNWLINPGSSTSTGVAWIAVAGEHTLRWEADPNGEVAEENEENNSLEFSFSVQEQAPGAKPDFLPCPSLANASYNYVAGFQEAFQICLTNQGESAGESSISLYFDGEKVYDTTWLINPTSTTSTGYGWIATSGTHSLHWVADEEDAVEELDETNNELQVFFTVP